MSIRPALFAAILAVASAPVASRAQSSLGFTGGEITLGALAVAGDSRSFAEGLLDVAITEAHGLQLDFGLEDTDAGALGHIAAHLYLQPRAGQKYGVFATVSDLDGQSFTVGAIGVEGHFALGERTALEVQAGIGIAHRITAPTALDYVFLGGGLRHDLGDTLTVGAHGTIAEYEEQAFQAVGYTLAFEAEYRPRRSPVALSAAIGVSGLEGRDGGPSESFVSLGLSYSFGAQGGDPSRRPFRRPDGYAPLALRGMF